MESRCFAKNRQIAKTNVQNVGSSKPKNELRQPKNGLSPPNQRANQNQETDIVTTLGIAEILEY